MSEVIVFLPVRESQFKKLFLDYLAECYPPSTLEWLLNKILDNLIRYYDETDEINYDKIIAKINKLQKRNLADDDCDHLGCFAYPNCDDDPLRCSRVSGRNAEQTGHKD